MNFEKEQLWRRLVSESGNHYEQLVEESDKEGFRKWVKNMLHDQVLLVEFTKADGETRIMHCTLSDLHGAKYKQTPIVENAEAAIKAEPKKINTDACPVWDVNAGAWRSFRWDRLKRIDYQIV